MAKIVMPDFHEGQQEIVRKFVLDDTKTYCAVCVGRQWGKTFLSMNIMIGWMLEKPARAGGWVTPYAKHWKMAFKMIRNAASGQISGSNITDGVITFTNGSTLSFYSTENEDSVRGQTFTHLIVDEAGFVKTSAFEVMLPVFGIIGEKALFISTPDVKNWFYSYVRDGNDESISNVISIKAPSSSSPFWTEDKLADVKRNTHPIKFKQEYLAEFTDSAGGVFIDFNKRAVVSDYVKSYDGECYFGLDIARGGADFTSLTIMNDTQVINREYWHEWDTETQVEKLKKVLDEYPNIVRGYVEENQEVAIFQALRRHYSDKFPVLGFYTTTKNKPDLIQNLATDINKGDLLLPSRELDKLLYEEFADFSFEKKEGGYIKYSAPDNKHDDSVMSTALANEARVPVRHIRRNWMEEFNNYNKD